MTDVSHPVSFDDLKHWLEQANAYLGASEAHGVLCGFICAGFKGVDPKWIDVVVGDATEMVEEKTRRLLKELFTVSIEQLNSFDLNFQLLLPNDEIAIEERVEGLTNWVQGFLLGLSMVKGAPSPDQSEELQETLADLTEIANADVEFEEAEPEEVYTELSEYVRLAAMMVFTEFSAKEVVYH